MSTKPNYKSIVITATIIVVTFWAATFLLFFFQNNEQRGTFGDMFGAVNALFSGLAFAGIILTIYMQREELALQRKELEETRQVFQKQAGIMAAQQNDATFFHLLQNHRNTIESLNTTERRYYKIDRGGHGVKNEFVSGYQYLENRYDYILEYCRDYSEMYRSEILWSITEQMEAPKNYIVNDEKIIMLVNELNHVFSFIETRFNDSADIEFYRQTLINSLLEAEIFIYDFWMTVQDNSEHRIYPDLDFYENYNFIDFNQKLIPNCEFKVTHDDNQSYLQIISNGYILGVYSVINHHLINDKDNSWEIVELNMDEINEGKISMVDYFGCTTLGIKKFPVSDEFLEGFGHKEFYLVAQIEMSSKRYFLPVGLNIDTKPYRGKLHPMLKDYYSLLLNGREPKELGKDLAFEIVDRVKTKV